MIPFHNCSRQGQMAKLLPTLWHPQPSHLLGISQAGQWPGQLMNPPERPVQVSDIAIRSCDILDKHKRLQIRQPTESYKSITYGSKHVIAESFLKNWNVESISKSKSWVGNFKSQVLKISTHIILDDTSHKSKGYQLIVIIILRLGWNTEDSSLLKGNKL